jgi:hypothetical protein
MSIGKTTELSLVTAAQISAGAVGTAAISSGAATSGQILQANGSGAVAFATLAASGGMTLISTATPIAATTVSFTSIPSTYKHLMLIWHSVYQSIDNEYWWATFNNDSTVANYDTTVIGPPTTGTSVSVSNTTTVASTPQSLTRAIIASGGTSLSAYTSKGALTIYRYTDTSVRLFEYRSSALSTLQTNNTRFTTANGFYNGSSAISSIEFTRSSTQTITGTFYLYGVSSCDMK